jgi:hypothetical protein
VRWRKFREYRVPSYRKFTTRFADIRCDMACDAYENTGPGEMMEGKNELH